MSRERRDAAADVAVTVNVVTHNQREWIHDTLQSVSAQKCSFPIEIVIADDASTDGTREAALEWAANYDGVCRVLPPAERLGVSANHRRAFAAARGDAIAVLEGDDVWIRSDKLERQYLALGADPSLAMVACRHLIVDGTGAAGIVSPLIEATAFRARLTSEDLADSNWFGTFSTTMFRREAVEKIRDAVWEAGPYDWLLAMAVTERGDALLLGEIGTVYRQHRGGVWSSEAAHTRARALRAALPRYREALGGRLDAALSRVEWHLDHGIAHMPESTEDDPAPSSGRSEVFAVPLPQPNTVPELSMVVVIDSPVTSRVGLEHLLGPVGDPYELIVVSIVDRESPAELFSNPDPRVRQFCVPHQTDRVSALNLGIQQARAEVVAIIDSDRPPERHLLMDQLDRMVSGASDVMVVRPEGVAEVEDPCDWQRALYDSLEKDWSRALVRRAALDEHGLFDPLLGDHCFVDRWSALAAEARIVGSDAAVASVGERGPSTPVTAVEALDRLVDRVVDSEGLEAFRDLTRPYPADDAVRRECLMIVALLADTSETARVRWTVGARRLRRALASPLHRRVLRTEHQITEYHVHDVERALADQTSGRGLSGIMARGLAVVSRLIHRWGRPTTPSR